MGERILFTLQPGSETYGENELRRTGLSFRLLPRLDAGVCAAEIAQGFPALAAAFRQKPPVFIRHVCPAGLKTERIDEETLCEGAARFRDRLETDLPYSVQLRLLGGTALSMRRGPLQAAMAARLEGPAPLSVRVPEQILSCAVTPQGAYFGLSRANDNLSAWAGGCCHFRLDDPISRAEGKLLEAFDLFRPELPEGGRALDLGAAPGGWTRVLRRMGFSVTAVDPAGLDERVSSDPGVLHERMQAQQFFLKAPRPFDLMVNDMRMDARLSARLTNDCADWLVPGAYAIMTAKLPKTNAQRCAAQAIRDLSRRYRVLFARQLFHNRSEITILAQKPGKQ